jgi:acyl-CoA dehydrogenase
VHDGSSMIIVPNPTPGMDIVRNTAVGPRDEIGGGVHGYIRFSDCRVPVANTLGPVGEGFKVAQSRLGGGRIHHAMRTVGMLNKALDMMCERVVSRRTKGERLADKQMVQEKIAIPRSCSSACMCSTPPGCLTGIRPTRGRCGGRFRR